MYLHLGNNAVVEFSDIIGIFDLDITSQSAITKNFLRCAEQKGLVSAVSDDLPKSFVVTSDTVYLSQLASTTLRGRAENFCIT